MENVVDRLLHGSDELHHMAESVNQLVRMIVGLVPINEFANYVASSSHHYSEPGAPWWVFDRRHADGKMPLFECLVKEGDHTITLYSTREGFTLPLINVYKVYDALPSFVEWMVEHFSVLKERIKPILDAAEISEVRKKS